MLTHVGVSARQFTVHNRAICAYYKAMVSDSDPFGQKCAMVSGAKCLIVSSHGEGRGNRGVDLAGFCLAKQLLF